MKEPQGIKQIQLGYKNITNSIGIFSCYALVDK